MTTYTVYVSFGDTAFEARFSCIDKAREFKRRMVARGFRARMFWYSAEWEDVDEAERYYLGATVASEKV